MLKKITLLIVFVFLLSTGFVTAQKICDCPEFKAIKKEQKFDNGEVLSDADITKLLSSGNILCQAKGYEMIGAGYVQKKMYDSAGYFFSKEESLCKKSGCDDSVMIRCNFQWYYLYYSQGKYKEALEYQFKNLDITKKANNYYELAFCYLDITRVFQEMGQSPKAMEYCRLSIPYIEKIADPYLKAQACFNLSHRYLFYSNENNDPGLIDTATKYVKMAIQLGQQSGSIASVCNGYYQLAGIAFTKKNYPESLRLNDSSLVLCHSMGNNYMAAYNFIDKADTYVEMGDMKEAKRMADSALLYAKLDKNINPTIDVYAMMGEIAEKNNDYKGALDAFKNERKISDSIMTAEKSKAINELEQKYNKSQNEIRIKDLSKQKQLYLLLSLAGLFALIGLVFFIRQLTLKNKQKILETEQRLNRARMNPHFFFNALTTLQKFALRDNDGQAMASNLSKFSNIMRETLESTYKEYVTIEQEMEFLNEYLEVQKIRFPQTFSYQVNADKDLDIDELQIPAMIIQPFVENSIEHGFVGVDYPGNVSVEFGSENNELLIQITDNGKGLSTTVKENNEHISRASQIIKDRIYLLNIKLKTKAGFSIDNNSTGNGVIVKIHLPLLYKE